MTRPRSLSKLLVLTAVGAVVLAAALMPSSALAAGGTSTITGTLVAPSATVAGDLGAELYDLGGGEIDGSPTLTVSGDTVTYTFSDEPAGSYVLGFYDDHAAADDIAPIYYGGTASFAAAVHVTVAAGATTTLSPTTISAGGQITGTITDPNLASSFAHSKIEACPLTPDVDTSLGCVSGGAIADSGAYTISGLAAGVYRLAYTPATSSSDGEVFSDVQGLDNDDGTVFVSGSTVTSSVGQASTVTVSAGATATVDFADPQAASITGTVTVGDVPSSSVVVTAYDSAGELIGETLTTTGGTYKLSLLPGVYKVEFMPSDGLLGASPVAPAFYGGATFATATALTLTAGGSAAGVNADLETGATIAGTLTAGRGEAPVGGLGFELVNASDSSAFGALAGAYSTYLQTGGLVSEFANTVTAADGTYKIIGVPAGTWYLEFVGGLAWNGDDYASIFYGGKPTIVGAKAIKVTAGENLTGVDQAILTESTTAPGLPKSLSPSLSGIDKDKVALKFKVEAGSGVAADLHLIHVKLPKHFSWAKSKLKSDLTLGTGVTFSYSITDGELYLTIKKTAVRSVTVTLKAGAITVTSGIEKDAKEKKIASEKIDVSVTDMIGTLTEVPFTVKKPA